MKRIWSNKKAKKIVLRKWVSSKTSNKIQIKNNSQLYILQNTSNQTLLNNEDNDNESLHDILSNENQRQVSLDEYESNFITTSSELSDSDQSEETERHFENSKSAQTIEEGETNFQPLPGEYGPYFQNFTEMMLFTWVFKLVLFIFVKFCLQLI